MSEPAAIWPRRTAGILALLHAAYIVAVIALIAAAVVGTAQAADRGNAWAGLALFAFAMPLLIGLAIVSPLLTWLIVLGRGLLRGRRRIPGIVTFALLGVALSVFALSGQSRIGPIGYVLSLVVVAGPSLAGMAVLLMRPQDFEPAVSAQSAATPPPAT